MAKHDGHRLFYVLDRCTVQIPVTITPEGDVTSGEDAKYQIVEYDGDSTVWCDDCNERIVGGEDGLSDSWMVV